MASDDESTPNDSQLMKILRRSHIAAETRPGVQENGDQRAQDADHAHDDSSHGGQLFKIYCKMFENPTEGRQRPPQLTINIDEDIPCPKGNVAHLKAQLSPFLFKQHRRTSSGSSLNSLLSKTSDSTRHISSSSYTNLTVEANYENVPASSSIQDRTRQVYVNESMLHEFKQRKCLGLHSRSSNVSSSCSSQYEDFEIVEIYDSSAGEYEDLERGVTNMRLAGNESKVDGVAAGDNGDDDCDDNDDENIYEDIEPRSNNRAGAITDAELGLEDHGEGKKVDPVVMACNSVMKVEESEKRKAGRRLKDLTNELIQTEIKYVDDMRHVIEDYIPLLFSPAAPAAKNFTKDNIFSNIEELHHIHRHKFLPELKKHRRSLKKIAKTFLEYEDVFHMYVDYLSKNKNATNIVFQNKPFFEKKRKEVGRSLDLSSYLLSPVQRLPRYVLFIEDIIKSYKRYAAAVDVQSDSVRKSSISWESDDELPQKIETIENNVEEKDEKLSVVTLLEMAKESLKKVLKLANDSVALENIANPPVLLKKLTLLRHEEFSVTEVSTKKTWQMRCFLFEEMLLFTLIDVSPQRGEVYIYQDHIEMSKLGITPPETHFIEKICVWCEKRTYKNYILEGPPRILKDWYECLISMLWKEAISKKEIIKNLQGKNWHNSLRSVKKNVNTLPSQTTQQPQDQSKEKSHSSVGLPRKIDKNRRKRRGTTWYI